MTLSCRNRTWEAGNLASQAIMQEMRTRSCTADPTHESDPLQIFIARIAELP